MRDGKPKGLNGSKNSSGDAQRPQGRRRRVPLAGVTGDGNFMFRTIYSLVCQQDGELQTNGEFLAGDNAQKLQKRCGVCRIGPRPGSSRPIRTILHRCPLHQRQSGLMINGVWEVPTMVDLTPQGKLFDWGAIEIPVIFDHPSTYADSHPLRFP